MTVADFGGALPMAQRPPMRVAVSCLLFGRQPFGVGSYIRGLVEGLQATAGARSIVLYHRRAMAPVASSGAIEQHAAPWATGVRGMRVLWEQMALPDRCRDDGVDVLHSPGYILPARSKLPAVVTVHDAFTEVAPQFCKPLNRLHHSLLLHRSIVQARLVITPSEAVRRQLRQIFPEAADRIFALLPGIDSAVTQRPDGEFAERVRRRLRLPRRFLLWAGNLEPKKNVERLLLGYRIARRRGLKCALVMVGGRGWGSIPPEVLSRQEGVRWLGYVSRAELRVLYRDALMLVFPSLAEGVGFPVLEAMANGTPVVCSAIPAALETDAKAVELVDPADAQSIAEGICRVARDPGLQAEMGAAGRRATRDLSWDRYAGRMWSLYERLR